jgi:hypothetical protein
MHPKECQACQNKVTAKIVHVGAVTCVRELIAALRMLDENAPVRVQLDYMNLTEESYGAHDVMCVYQPSHGPVYLGVLYKG